VSDLSEKTSVPLGWMFLAVAVTVSAMLWVRSELARIDSRLVRIETTLHMQTSEAVAPAPFPHHEKEL
jgi:hypothetical protein